MVLQLKSLCYFCLCFESKFFLVFELDESEVAEKMYSAHLRRTPRPHIQPSSNLNLVNEAPKSYPSSPSDWLKNFFYICIHLNHITSCNPLLNTILIVMGHVISHVIQYSKNMMLFSRPVSYTKIPPVYIPTSITPCTISRNYYN